MKITTLLMTLVLAAAMMITGCKKNDDSSPTAPTTPSHAAGAYVGMIAGGSESGVLSLNISTTSPKNNNNYFALTVYTVSGTITVGGTSITLTGTYNTANDSLYVSGGGYSFSGVFSNGVLTGSYTGPHGSGGFSSQSASGSDSVRVYLGTAVSLAGHSGATLNIVTKGSALVGLASGGSGDKVPFYGTISGSAITLKITVGGVTFNLGSGTVSSDFRTVSGTYNTSSWEGTEGDNGTWSGQRYR